jgi:hypothetical protein
VFTGPPEWTDDHAYPTWNFPPFFASIVLSVSDTLRADVKPDLKQMTSVKRERAVRLWRTGAEGLNLSGEPDWSKRGSPISI